MKAIVQRVSSASVVVAGSEVARIGPGLMVLLGVTHSDTAEDVAWMARKLAQLRIFEDAQGLMNRSLEDVRGAILVVSQFTLYGDARKGNRPSFIAAARPEQAEPHYQALLQLLRERLGAQHVQGGVFGAAMQIHLVNEGPVTIDLQSPAQSCDATVVSKVLK